MTDGKPAPTAWIVMGELSCPSVSLAELNRAFFGSDHLRSCVFLIFWTICAS